MAGLVRLGLGQPRSVLGDVEHNVGQHAAIVRGLEADVVVFPELSLTGYDMGVAPVEPDDPRLEPLVDASAEASVTALVGAPTIGPDGVGKQISVLRIAAGSVDVAYRKVFLGGDEPDHFVPGTAPTVIEVGGVRLGLAICKDTGVPEHAAAVAELGMDVYVAGVCEAEADHDVQPERAARIIGDHRVWVAFAGFAGPTGGGFTETAGRSAVVDPDGHVRLRLPRDAGHAGWTSILIRR